MYSINYDQQDDILQIKLSGKQICKEVSQDWNTHVSFAEDGSVVEIVLLDFQQSFKNKNFFDNNFTKENLSNFNNFVKN